MKLEHGKKYVTQGGWIVEIMLVKYGELEQYFITQKTSPGVSIIDGKTAAEYSKSYFSTSAQHCGWQYTKDGEKLYQQIQGIDPKDFKIVGEYPCKLDPPGGYVWAGGFPKVEEPVNGKTYLTTDDYLRAIKMSAGTDWLVQPVIGKRRILLEPVAPQAAEHSVEVVSEYYIPTSKYTWDTHNKYFVKRGKEWYGWNPREGIEVPEARDEYWQQLIKDKIIVPCSKEDAIERVKGKIPTEVASEQYYVPTSTYTGAQNKYFVKRGNAWLKWDWFTKKEVNDDSGEGFWQHFIADGRIKPSTKEEAMTRVAEVKSPPVAATPPQFVAPQDCFVSVPIPKEEQMSSSTFVNLVESAASRTFGAVNHLYIEPAKIIGGYVKRSLRYVVFFGTLTGIVYGVNDPASLKKKVASCMPKITIEAPPVLK